MQETVKSLIWAAAIALMIRCFAYEPFSIPSSSMVPTLEVGDYLFVSKFSYGYSSLSSFFGFPVVDRRTSNRRPERGDVAVFKLPSNTKIDYIKRVIGLPGDRIQVAAGRLYINGQLVQRNVVEAVEIRKSGPARKAAILYTETLPGGRQHLIVEEGDAGPLDNTQEFIVPDRHYFMMGDNRDNSQDSRVKNLVGFVPEENLVGRADVIFFSLAEGTSFIEFWRWATDVRFDRIFDVID